MRSGAEQPPSAAPAPTPKLPPPPGTPGTPAAPATAGVELGSLLPSMEGIDDAFFGDDDDAAPPSAPAAAPGPGAGGAGAGGAGRAADAGLDEVEDMLPLMEEPEEP